MPKQIVQIDIPDSWERFIAEEAKRRQERDSQKANWKPVHPNSHRIGMLCQMALGSYLGMRLDMTKERDPGYDFDIRGHKIQCKGTETLDMPLVRAPCQDISSIYVMTKLFGSFVCLFGWCFQKLIAGLPTERSAAGPWDNHIPLQHSQLKDIYSLRSWLSLSDRFCVAPDYGT